MSKRTAGTLPTSKTRKRRRNGITSSSAVLEFKEEIPPDLTQGMRARETNAENPGVIPRSAIPLQREVNEVQPEGSSLYQPEDAPVETGQRKKKRDRKRVNNSVSLSGPDFSCWYNSLNRRKRWTGFVIECMFSTNSHDTMAYEDTPHLPYAPTVSTTRACSDV